MFKLSERWSVGLEGGSHPFEVVNGQTLRVTKSVFIAVPMDTAIGHPAGPTGVAIGAQTSLSSDEAERVERRQPRKPFRRIGRDVQFSLLWADEHITASGSIFDQWDKTISLLSGMTRQWRYGWLV